MSVLFLIPGCISLFLVLTGRIKRAFLSVYLPSLFLLSPDYRLRLPHLPPFSAAQYALMPIGIIALTRHVCNRSFRLMDALVLLFWVSFLASEVLREPIMNTGILAAAQLFVAQLLAYVVGRQLIEPDLRFTTVRRFVIFVLLLCPIGVYEWRFGRSVYGIVGQTLFGIIAGQYGEGIQIRNGRGRFTASFGGSEFAGMVIAMTFALNAWLVFVSRKRRKVSLGRWLAQLEKYHVPALVMMLCIWLTQSRGALLSLAIAYIILQIPEIKNTKLATIAVAVILALAAFGAKQYFTEYVDVAPWRMTEEQSSAAYREVMNKVYQSVAERGGWLGWAGDIPVVGGRKSIDNQFLLTHLIQGECGYVLLILIAAESIRTGIAGAWNLRASEDRVFACSMLATFAIFWVAYYTVFMGGQLTQITFLMLGWGQSLVQRKQAKIGGKGSVAVQVAAGARGCD